MLSSDRLVGGGGKGSVFFTARSYCRRIATAENTVLEASRSRPSESLPNVLVSARSSADVFPFLFFLLCFFCQLHADFNEGSSHIAAEDKLSLVPTIRSVEGKPTTKVFLEERL